MFACWTAALELAAILGVVMRCVDEKGLNERRWCVWSAPLAGACIEDGCDKSVAMLLLLETICYRASPLQLAMLSSQQAMQWDMSRWLVVICMCTETTKTGL